ncbi:MAG TPA: hypothetical protein VM093_07870 [Aeromicrobium sp.]|nr:hypothetical protein [Aeromicrobium sp.]
MTDVPIDVPALAKKSSISWIQVGSQTHPVWHEWVDGDDGGALCLVGSVDAGGSEQPIPALTDGDQAVVLLRSKTDRQLAAAVPVVASVVQPGSVLWEPVTAALKAARLNARDPDSEVDRWARACRVLRLVPQGRVTPAGELPHDRPRTAPRLS